MALINIFFLGLLVIYVCAGVSGIDSAGFPLHGCSTDDMDVLCLYFDSDNDFYLLDNEKSWCRQFVLDLSNLSPNRSTTRVHFAGVVDRFSSGNESVDIGSWRFRDTFMTNTYGQDQLSSMIRRFKTAEVIEPKIKLVERLFSEMSGVRENVTHVAVIFIDGASLSYEESRKVPRIVNQLSTDIKIFVVVMGVSFNKDMLLLNNTLLLSREVNKLPKRSLTLAICGQCMDGWWSFEDPGSSDPLSCYLLFDFGEKVDYNRATSGCYNVNSRGLVNIESTSELDFLRSMMHSDLIRRGSNGSDVRLLFPALVHIGLIRDTKTITGRFKWGWTDTSLYRPLTVNNWTPGRPSGGYNTNCAMWQFNLTDVKAGSTNVTNRKQTFTDGWSDVRCYGDLSPFGLCEVTFPNRVETKNLMRINPANRGSLNKALTRGDFYEFEGNIVSVSANTANRDFVAFFKQTEGYIFPTFDCGPDAGNPRYISYLNVCDRVDHCSNKRDEASCFVDTGIPQSTEIQDETMKCLGIMCCDGFCLPLQFVNDGEVDCAVCEYSSGNRLNDESSVLNKYLKRNETCAFICNRNDCVLFSQLNDGGIDCSGPEGPIDETIGKLETAGTCYNILGHATWAPKCVYVRDMYGNVMGCRDMSHVKNCSEFLCPEGYFKCPNTYCIPQHYVLDGTVDCPRGEDEQFGNIEDCTGNFACWDSKMCLHPDLVCDGHPDCPRGDDEADCEVTCADGFHCVSGTVTVADYNRSIPLKRLSFLNPKVKYLDLSDLDLSTFGEDVRRFLTHASFVKWSNCRISDLPSLLGYYSREIQELDASHNLIETLDGSQAEFFTLQNIRLLNLSCNKHLVDVKYFQFTLLETLDLSHTGLSRVNNSVLTGLPSLKTLNLSFTHIHHFHKNTFPSQRGLQTLDLRGLTVKHIYRDIFNGLVITHDLFCDSFELCCPQIRGANIPYYTCHTSNDAISSCFDLVGLDVQRVLLWVVAVLAVVGNLTVIVYRVIWDRSVLRTGYGLFVTNLGISDFIMGVYLFIIAGADYYYRGVYVLSDRSWRGSDVCRLAGFLATLSCETSTLFVSLITLDRFLVMKFPFGEIRFSHVSKSIALILSWITGFLLALTPAVFRFEIYSSNAMCLGLPLTNKLLSGWQFSFGVFVVLNFGMFLLIAYGQRAIYKAISENRIAGTVSRTSPRRAEDILAVKQLSLVAVSNFLCWFPVGLVGLLSISGQKISNNVYAWITVTVLPINSAANPLLYTMSFLMARWEKFRSGNRHQSSVYT